MAEIRIPYDRIPADIWRRLRDISNEVINPFTTQDAAASSVSAAAAASSLSATTASNVSSETSAAGLFSLSPEMALAAMVSSQQASMSTSASISSSSSSPLSSNRKIKRLGVKGSKNRTRTLPFVPVMTQHNDDSDVTDADCDVDEVDGGDIDSSIVHVVDDVTLRHQNSSRVSAMEVMDESDIVRIFPDADISGKPAMQQHSDLNSNKTSSPDSGIVRIFPHDDDNDDDDDNDNSDVVDHMTSINDNNIDNNKKKRKAQKSSAFKISPRVYPNFIPETTDSIYNKTTPLLTSFPATSNNTECLHQQFPRQNFDSLSNSDDRLSRLSAKSISRFSQYKDLKQRQTHTRIGKSMYATANHSQTQQPVQFNQYNQILSIQNPSNEMSQHCEDYNTSQISTMGNNKVKILPSTPSKYMNAIETTPTKVLRKSPSNFGKIRRSPGFLPTPPQTPDDANDDDDDEVFSYDDIISRSSCTNMDTNNDSANLRRNSESRTNDIDRVVRRSSTRSSPFPFSPTNKMACMRVGDRLHSRKRLSFEGLDSTMTESLNEMDHSTDTQYWSGNNNNGMQNRQQYSANQRSVDNIASGQKLNIPPTRGKSTSPRPSLNSPPRSHLHSSAYPSTSPAPLGCDNVERSSTCNFDIERQPIRPSSSVQACSSSSINSYPSPHPSHRSLMHPTICKSSSLNNVYSDQSYPFANTLNHDVTTEDAEITQFRNSRYSPTKDINNRIASHHQFAVERKPRLRIHSEGFSEENIESVIADIGRCVDSEDDSLFSMAPRAKTSIGKRRRLDYDEEDDDDDDDTNLLLHPPSPLQKSQSPPPQPAAAAAAGRQSPPQSSPNTSSIITTPNPRIPTFSTSPQVKLVTSQQEIITSQQQIMTNNNNNNNSHHNQAISSSSSSTPHENCSCATFLRNFLSMASCAYKNLKPPTGDFTDFRQEMAKTNDMLRESMSIMNNIRAMCEHHRTMSPPQLPSFVIGQGSTTTTSATSSNIGGASSDAFTNIMASAETDPATSSSPLSLFSSFNFQQDPNL